MKVINLNTSENVKFVLYPDNQPHVIIDTNSISEGDEVKVVCSIIDAQKLIHLVQCSNALDNMFVKKKVLVVPYLMGARFDRVMQPGDSLDLKIVADLINYCGFEKVYLLDAHSDASKLLIKNSVNIDNFELVSRYKKPNSVLICPDAGAVKKVATYLKWNKKIVDVVYCTKFRNLSTGELTIEVLHPEKCLFSDCVIIDDLCDGGGTFMGIASQIQPLSLTLIVTHGIFSKGTKLFEGVFDEIIVTNSFCRDYESNIVNLVNYESCLTNI
jgi:ribose-phosphate pyrophosphokinase